MTPPPILLTLPLAYPCRPRVPSSVVRHGADLPNASWSDGVAGVSQAPIPPGSTFRYKFKAEPAGTLWYHSHTGMQFGDGLRGPMIVEVRLTGRGCGLFLVVHQGGEARSAWAVLWPARTTHQHTQTHSQPNNSLA